MPSCTAVEHIVAHKTQRLGGGLGARLAVEEPGGAGVPARPTMRDRPGLLRPGRFRACRCLGR